MISTFILFTKVFGWKDTFYPLTVPSFFVFLLRQFYMTLPFELDDAATIDGCSKFGVFLRILLEVGRCACPAEEVTARLHRQRRDRDRYGKQVPSWAFVFEGAICDGCPVRPQCVKAASRRGRSVSLHPQEGLLRKAWAFAPYRT